MSVSVREIVGHGASSGPSSRLLSTVPRSTVARGTPAQAQAPTDGFSSPVRWGHGVTITVGAMTTRKKGDDGSTPARPAPGTPSQPRRPQLRPVGGGKVPRIRPVATRTPAAPLAAPTASSRRAVESKADENTTVMARPTAARPHLPFEEPPTASVLPKLEHDDVAERTLVMLDAPRRTPQSSSSAPPMTHGPVGQSTSPPVHVRSAPPPGPGTPVPIATSAAGAQAANVLGLVVFFAAPLAFATMAVAALALL